MSAERVRAIKKEPSDEAVAEAIGMEYPALWGEE